MNTRKFLLNTQLKRSKRSRKSAGFTLIELLVAIILAALVITPLLGFMINILSTDRQEQVKATSEQEIQAAADYINRDLQQAVYIYDQQALHNNSDPDDPENSGIKDQLYDPPGDDIPVLAFWKRELVKDIVPISRVHEDKCPGNDEYCNDTFVYSLVTYYLIKEDNPTWSEAYRIGRFEVSDGVENPFIPGAYIPGEEPDPGFASFGGFSGSLRSKMNRWTKDGDYDPQQNPLNVLVDYIDHTTESDVEDKEDIIPEKYGANNYCPPDSDPNDVDPEWTQVPDYNNIGSDFKTFSFYACVHSSANTAKVFLRGNALARLRANREDSKYSEGRSSYFPSTKIEVKGIGALSGG